MTDMRDDTTRRTGLAAAGGDLLGGLTDRQLEELINAAQARLRELAAARKTEGERRVRQLAAEYGLRIKFLKEGTCRRGKAQRSASARSEEQ